MKVGVALAFATASALGGVPVLSFVALPYAPKAYTPPAACIEWYDGCNMCTREADGTVSCTDRSCANLGKGFCRSEAPQTATSTPDSPETDT